MSKTAKTDTIEMAAFDTTAAVDQLRNFTEKSVEQSKETYAKLKAGAEEAQKTIETTYETARSVSADLTLKTIAAMRANAEANFSHMEKLIAAKSFSEVLELQTAFLRQRMEMTLEQAKEMQAASTKAAEDLSKPAKTAVDKAMTELKAA
ncbi:MAG: phasin [Rhizobiaceae bacterium]|nr:phasin [Rhizobiaceae bacterium]MCV0406087.1 phasin [Rhizobiaceae bacterium]